MKRDFVQENPRNASRKLEIKIMDKSLRKKIKLMRPIVDTTTPFMINMATFQAGPFFDRHVKTMFDGRRNN